MIHTYIMIAIIILIGTAATAIGLSMMYIHKDHMTVARQHIADLEQLLSNLLDAKAELDHEIDATTHRLLDANAQLDAKTLCRYQIVKASWIDREFQDVVPHTY